MVQNHILQLLCLVAMEPPGQVHAGAVRDEKLKVLRALKPLYEAFSTTGVVRGQYRSGAAAAAPCPAIWKNSGPIRRTETFVALKAEILNR